MGGVGEAESVIAMIADRQVYTIDDQIGTTASCGGGLPTTLAKI
jgi:hypothetical protein